MTGWAGEAVIGAFMARVIEFSESVDQDLRREMVGVAEGAEQNAGAFDAVFEHYRRRFHDELAVVIRGFEESLKSRPRTERRFWKSAKPKVMLRVNARMAQHLEAMWADVEREKERFAATGADFAAMVADIYG